MAATSNFKTRIGCGEIELDAYGGDFSSPVSLGHPHEDGITVEQSMEYVKVKSGKTGGIREIFKPGGEVSFECMLLEHRARNLALSFGRNMSVITDNTGGTPPNETFDLKNFEVPDYYALRFKSPQPDDPDLYDTFLAYRVAVIAKFSQAFKVGDARYIPVRFECTEDPENGDKYGTVTVEYDEGDLP